MHHWTGYWTTEASLCQDLVRKAWGTFQDLPKSLLQVEKHYFSIPLHCWLRDAPKGVTSLSPPRHVRKRSAKDQSKTSQLFPTAVTNQRWCWQDVTQGTQIWYRKMALIILFCLFFPVFWNHCIFNSENGTIENFVLLGHNWVIFHCFSNLFPLQTLYPFKY